MKTFFLCALIAISVAGCKKEEIKDCEANAYGALAASNETSTELRIKIDGIDKGFVQPNSISTFNYIPSGYHVINANQIGAPGISWSGTHEIKSCETLGLSYQ